MLEPIIAVRDQFPMTRWCHHLRLTWIALAAIVVMLSMVGEAKAARSCCSSRPATTCGTAAATHDRESRPRRASRSDTPEAAKAGLVLPRIGPANAARMSLRHFRPREARNPDRPRLAPIAALWPTSRPPSRTSHASRAIESAPLPIRPVVLAEDSPLPPHVSPPHLRHSPHRRPFPLVFVAFRSSGSRLSGLRARIGLGSENMSSNGLAEVPMTRLAAGSSAWSSRWSNSGSGSWP